MSRGIVQHHHCFLPYLLAEAIQQTDNLFAARLAGIGLVVKIPFAVHQSGYIHSFALASGHFYGFTFLLPGIRQGRSHGEPALITVVEL